MSALTVHSLWKSRTASGMSDRPVQMPRLRKRVVNTRLVLLWTVLGIDLHLIAMDSIRSVVKQTALLRDRHRRYINDVLYHVEFKICILNKYLF